MSKRTRLLPLALTGAVAMTLFSSVAAGAVACLAGPDRTPADGEHWYYRTNRKTNQKCWYLRVRDVETTGATMSTHGTRAAAAAEARSDDAPLTVGEQRELFREFLQWRLKRELR